MEQHPRSDQSSESEFDNELEGLFSAEAWFERKTAMPTLLSSSGIWRRNCFESVVANVTTYNWVHLETATISNSLPATYPNLVSSTNNYHKV
jgi:hypothetical protein